MGLVLKPLLLMNLWGGVWDQRRERGKGRELGAGDGCFELMKTRRAGTLHCFSQTNSCPLCRHELPTDDDTYEEHKRDKVGGWASGGGGHRAP